MATVVLQQVSSPFARKNAGGTLEKPVGLRFITKYLEPPLIESLQKIAPDGAIRIWGAKQERSHQFRKMPPLESFVFFRRGRRVFAHGLIAQTTVNESLAVSLWGRDGDGKTWPLIFFLRRVNFIDKDAARFNVLLGRKPTDNWQGMTAISVTDGRSLMRMLKESCTVSPNRSFDTDAQVGPLPSVAPGLCAGQLRR